MIARIAHLRRRHGFSLIELMVVVAIVGILAVLAVVGYGRWLRHAKVAETKDLIMLLTLGQHQYYRDTDGYLNCSSSFVDYYPTAPNSKKHQFHDPANTDYACFRLLNTDNESASYMAFVTVAGAPGDGIPALPIKQQLNLAPKLDRPWFIVMAMGDLDEDGVMSYFMTSSFQPGEIHVENEYE